MKFTDLWLKKLKPNSDVPYYEVWESDGGGMSVLVFRNGNVTFRFNYTFGGKRKRLSLGAFPEVSLKDARTRRDEARIMLARGEDPGKKEEPKQELTVKELGQIYLEKYASKKRSKALDERNLLKEVYPTLGKRPANEIKRHDIKVLLERIAQRPAPCLANRVLALIRKMYNFALDEELLSIEANPAQRIKHEKEKGKDRHLSNDELKVLLTVLPGVEGVSDQVKRAILLVLATGQRPGEVAGIRWEEIKDRRWWELPAERTKNGHPNRVWLSAFALEQIGEPQTEGPIFTSQTGAALREPGLAHALRRLIRDKDLDIAPFSPHDLRRTAATGWAALGVPRIVAMKILNHADRTITAIYDRHSYDGQVKAALDKWSDHLTRIKKAEATEHDNVVQFPINR